VGSSKIGVMSQSLVFCHDVFS